MEIKIDDTWYHVTTITARSAKGTNIVVGDNGGELEIEDIKFAGVTFLGDDIPEIPEKPADLHKAAAKDPIDYAQFRTEFAIDLYRYYTQKGCPDAYRLAVDNSDQIARELRETFQKGIQDLQN